MYEDCARAEKMREYIYFNLNIRAAPNKLNSEKHCKNE